MFKNYAAAIAQNNLENPKSPAVSLSWTDPKLK